MAMTIDGRQLSFTTCTDSAASAQIATSLLVPLPTASGLVGGSSLLLYAAAPGAFVDLAADLSYALQLDLSALVLDQDLPGRHAGDGIEGLRSWSDINQAVGVLLGRGHTIESAHDELRRLAALDSGNLHHAAAAVLAAIVDPEASSSHSG
jgi:hypothetical protein